MVSTYWSRTDHSEQVESNCPNATFRPGEEEWGGRSEDFAPHSSSVLSGSACSQAEPARPVLFRSWSSLIFRLSFDHSFCSSRHHERPRRSWSCGGHAVQHTNRKTYCHSSLLYSPLLSPGLPHTVGVCGTRFFDRVRGFVRRGFYCRGSIPIHARYNGVRLPPWESVHWDRWIR